jgi:hypothetical protein
MVYNIKLNKNENKYMTYDNKLVFIQEIKNDDQINLSDTSQYKRFIIKCIKNDDNVYQIRKDDMLIIKISENQMNQNDINLYNTLFQSNKDNMPIFYLYGLIYENNEPTYNYIIQKKYDYVDRLTITGKLLFLKSLNLFINNIRTDYYLINLCSSMIFYNLSDDKGDVFCVFDYEPNLIINKTELISKYGEYNLDFFKGKYGSNKLVLSNIDLKKNIKDISVSVSDSDGDVQLFSDSLIQLYNGYIDVLLYLFEEYIDLSEDVNNIKKTIIYAGGFYYRPFSKEFLIKNIEEIKTNIENIINIIKTKNTNINIIKFTNNLSIVVLELIKNLLQKNIIIDFIDTNTKIDGLLDAYKLACSENMVN